MKSERLCFAGALVALAVFALWVTYALGQSGDRIEFSADATATEFVEKGVVKRYTGNVVAVSGDLELRSDEAVYDSRIGETRLYGATTLRDTVRTVWADTLIYRDPTSEAIARGNVRGEEKGRSFRAGWIRYRRGLRFLEGFDGVTVRDDSLRSSMTGLSMAFNDSTHNGMVMGMPSLVREDDQGIIITLTAADTILVFQKEKTARIWNNVTVRRDSMQAVSAVAVYEDSLERVTMLGSPVVHHIMHGTGDEDKIPIRIASEVAGDTLYVFLKNRALDGVNVIGNSTGSAVATDSTGAVYYRSSLESRRMRVDLRENRISEVIAEGIASSYYMHAPSKKSGKMFVNTAKGDTIRFYFSEGHISDMRILGMGGGDATGKYYEFEPVKEKPDSVKKEDPKAKKRKK